MFTGKYFTNTEYLGVILSVSKKKFAGIEKDMVFSVISECFLHKFYELFFACQIVGDMQGAIFGGLLDGPLKTTSKRKYQVCATIPTW